MFLKKHRLGNLVVCLMLTMFLGFGSFIMPGTASAADISVTVTGDGVANPTTFTLEDLQNMPQVKTRLYSSINTWPSKKWYMATGPRLIDILKTAGIKDEATLITVKSRDGYKMTFTKKELLDDPRYCYPGLMNTGAGDGGGHIPGSPLEAERVDAILALQSADNADPAYMNSLNAPLLVFGQRWVTEQTNHAFAKYVSTIEVSTAPPAKWNNPTATPEAGIVPAGTGVGLKSPNNDADKAYYTTDGSDPSYKSLMYNWCASRWWSSRGDELDLVNTPIEINSDTTIKAVTIGLGKEDSDIVTFDYLVPFGSAGTGDMAYIDGKSTHTVAIKNDGTVWAWGNGHRGKLGDGKTGSSHWRSFPEPVDGLTGVTAVAPGYGHSLALKNDGTVWSWGGNSYGELGNGTSSSFEVATVPEQVYEIANVQAIAAGDGFSLALKDNGTVWSWGNNAKGQLGNNTKTKSTVAGEVYGLTNVQAIAAGKQHSLALKNDGTVWAWGYNFGGQLGNGSTADQLIPVQVSDLTGVKAIAASPDMSYAVDGDGTLWGWGFNSSGQLGPNGPTKTELGGYVVPAPSYVPFQITGITDVKEIAAGQGNVMVLQNDGTVLVWGSNLNGEFGNGEKKGSKEPVRVCGPEDGITAINAGENYMMAIKNDGTAWAWGQGYDGKLGDGTTEQYGERLFPTQVKRAPLEIIPAVEAVALGEAVELLFTDDANWKESITSVIVDNKAVNNYYYTKGEGKITIAPDVFTATGDYVIVVKAIGYADATVTQTINDTPAQPATYIVTFAVTPEDATVVVKDSENVEVTAETDGTYKLEAGEYSYTVSAEGYVTKTGNLTVTDQTQTITVVLEEESVQPDKPQYSITPAPDAIYTIGETEDGIKTMTLNSAQTGFKYFTVSVKPVKANEGTETVVFTHLRNGAQLQLNAAVADFDVVNTAKAGFNVMPGDIVKVYIVDQLTNDKDHNPIVFQ